MQEENYENPVAEVTENTVGAEEAQAAVEEPATPEVDSAEQQLALKSMHRNRLIYVGAAILLVAVAAFGYYKFVYLKHKNGSLDTLANSVVATVNGEQILRKNYALAVSNVLELAQQQQLDVNDPQVRTEIQRTALKNVIDERLIVQHARSEGMTVDDKKVDDNVAAVAKQVGGDAQLAAGLAKFDMSTDEFKQSVRDELLAAAYIDKNVDPSTLIVSDDEIASAYASAVGKAPAGSKIPALADVKSAIGDELKQKKQDAEVQSMLDGYRKDAKIVMATGTN